ncbi:MAG: hypothetical protein OET90_00880 [Desulfuromonadales bacterium]|nr:hypothetical protein [Desulfuromonadales bacterium]
MPRPSQYLFVLLAMLALIAISATAYAEQKNVGVLLSKEIAPYVDMVEGLEARLGNVEVQRFFLDAEGRPYSLSGLSNNPVPEQFAAMVAVGPEALRYLQPQMGSVPLIYGMVLNPLNFYGENRDAICGVPLNLPVESQLKAIQQHFPSIKRLGIFYDPKNNQAFYDEASGFAVSMELELISLQVRRTPAKLDIVGELARPEALLFIPDRTIISKAVVQHVIKDAYSRRIPVVGYNTFFHDSGAALSFVIDYRELGRQVGAQVLSVLGGGTCPGEMPPNFTAKRNVDAWRVLGLPDGKEAVDQSEEERDAP